VSYLLFLDPNHYWVPNFWPMLPEVRPFRICVSIFAVDLPPLSQILRDVVVYARMVPLPEVSFLVARLQHRPLTITTLTFPVKRSDNNKRSMDADKTSAALTFRRNSPKYLSSLKLSG
jgi:hypothetical protein